MQNYDTDKKWACIKKSTRKEKIYRTNKIKVCRFYTVEEQIHKSWSQELCASGTFNLLISM